MLHTKQFWLHSYQGFVHFHQSRMFSAFETKATGYDLILNIVFKIDFQYIQSLSYGLGDLSHNLDSRPNVMQNLSYFTSFGKA